MYGTEFKFEEKARVKLRGHVDSSFYAGMAKVGNEGWIAGRDRDRFGLPMVYIHWDPTHWAYNRQPDCWTYEDHFDLVEESQMLPEPEPSRNEVFARFLAESQRREAQSSESPVPAEPRNAVQEAHKILDNAEAFLVLTVHRHPHETAPDGMLTPTAVINVQTPEAEVLLGMQTAMVAHRLHADLGIAAIKRMTDPEGS